MFLKSCVFVFVVISNSRNLELEPTNKDDMAFFCYTSDTNGNPKGAVHLHRWVPGNDPSMLFWQHGIKNDILEKQFKT